MTKKRQSIDDSDEIRTLIKKRRIIKGKLTLFAKFSETLSIGELTDVLKTELQVRLQNVEQLYQQYSIVQDELDLKVSEGQLDSELEERQTFENQYYGIVAKAKCALNEKSSKNSANSNIKLPTISLPSFDGTYDHWLEFRDTYLSLIHKSKDIDDVQKLHYLRSALTGNALQVIKSLEFSASNYAVAWDLLENRYNNNRLLVHNHVKALFAAQSLSKESASLIRKLIDTILRNVRALKALDEPTDSWDTLIIYIMVSKLDSSTEREWELYKSTIPKTEVNAKIKLEDLIKFLKDRADVLETIKVSQNKSSSDTNVSKKQSSNYTHSCVAAHAHSKNNKHSVTSNSKRSNTRTCGMCNASHALYTCESFLNISIPDRIKFIEDRQLCRNCLRAGHVPKDCWFGPCKLCNRKHNSLLHTDCDNDAGASTSSAVARSEQATPQSEPSAGRAAVLHSASHSSHTLYDGENNTTHSLLATVLLSTALVEIADNNNKYHTFRALLDNGSQHCFVSQALCQKLNVPLIQSTVKVTGVGNLVTQSTQSCELQLRSKTSDFNMRFNCLVLPRITAQLPTIYSNTSLHIPDNVVLADSNFHSGTPIDLLIGADKFWGLLNDGLIRLNNGPYLQNTKLGWIISGALVNGNGRIKHVQCNYSQTLDSQLKQFWEIEEVQVPVTYSPDELACETLFSSSTVRNNSGQFEVRIPLRESADALGDSFATAENRFYALERKLGRSAPSYRQLYTDFMHEYLDLGHMSRIYEHSYPSYFLPHHGVFKEQSTTTKLRVVFDASAKSSSGKSLNDIQFTGPPLQNDIFSILLRFRQFRYVACADVEKMYRQILVQQDQRNLQLIFWRDDPSHPLGVYRLNTVTYGTASAPYLSIRCLKQLAADHNDDVIAQVISDDFYVDDLITGHDDKDYLMSVCDRVSDTLKSACFTLRKWVFNWDISNCVAPASKELSLGDQYLNKTLGLGWLHNSDELHYNNNVKFNENLTHVTKRIILSGISQIFDPLGLLSPTIIIVKILLQKIWLCKIGWDDPVPTEIVTKWNNFVKNLQHLQQLRIPRHVKGEHAQRTELHIFVDASQDAFGACAYMRTYDDSDDSSSLITANLLCAKSKVAPVNPLSVPRLELCAALVGAKLYEKIIKSLRLTFNKTYFWTDSTIVLGWLRMPPRALKTFVQNRVVQINELTGGLPWLHVAGKENPADLLSRGLSLDELNTVDKWWHGPTFLRDSEQNWLCKEQPCSVDLSELPELKTNTITLTCQSKGDVLFPFERFSSFSRMCRAAAYVLRFVKNIRIKTKSQRATGPLSVDELKQSICTLAKIVQLQSFAEVHDALLKNSPVRSTRNISNLNPFIDQNNLIRVGGRLSNSENFSFDKKHPVLLCGKHRFSRLLFQHEHKRLLHAGPQLMLSAIREQWWPLRGRSLARKIVHECVTCTRISGKTLSVQMGNLPRPRLEPGFPFLRCGVDYAGPMFTLNRKGRGAKLEKSYICIFVCFATRAVHLELVTSLTTEGYLLALKRFISRRGKPQEIYSDNGKNFVGAMKELSIFLKNNSTDLINFSADHSIKLIFLPPYTPHFGGLWEAGVKSCKFHIRRVIGNANLTYEEFSTVLAQVEAVLNSRPMCPLSADPNDFRPLSPSLFLIGRPLTAPFTEDLTTTATQRLARYDRVEQMRQQFWHRWSKEYISELQTRTKWQTRKEEILPNTLVLIKEDGLPPLKWRLGRVLHTFPGKDGISRVATIHTASGTIRRAFPKICPLPLQSED